MVALSKRSQMALIICSATTQDTMARDRRTDWRWTPPECLAELEALEGEDEELTQTSTKKQSKRTAA